jgi:hypothetical protein
VVLWCCCFGDMDAFGRALALVPEMDAFHRACALAKDQRDKVVPAEIKPLYDKMKDYLIAKGIGIEQLPDRLKKMTDRVNELYQREGEERVSHTSNTRSWTFLLAMILFGGEADLGRMADVVTILHQELDINKLKEWREGSEYPKPAASPVKIVENPVETIVYKHVDAAPPGPDLVDMVKRLAIQVEGLVGEIQTMKTTAGGEAPATNVWGTMEGAKCGCPLRGGNHRTADNEDQEATPFSAARMLMDDHHDEEPEEEGLHELFDPLHVVAMGPEQFRSRALTEVMLDVKVSRFVWPSYRDMAEKAIEEVVKLLRANAEGYGLYSRHLLELQTVWRMATVTSARERVTATRTLRALVEKKNLTQAFRQEENKQKAKMYWEGGGRGVAERGQSGGGGRTCFSCGQMGHMAKDCRGRAPDAGRGGRGGERGGRTH